ncbi:hypothetical protein [Celeribacter persicus]|nr:hypothetical protein [Celeribacter persicus]
MTENQPNRPDMIATEVKDCGHVPFLNGPESLNVIARFLEVLA